LIAGAVTVLSVVRQTGTPAWQSLWAEDGAEFLLRAINEGASSLTKSYSGYGLLLPRLIALLAAALHLGWAPWILSIGAALVAGLLSAFAFVASRAYLRSTALSYAAALALGLSPVAQIESMNCTANVQWYLMPALFWALLWCPTIRTGRIVASLLGLFAFGSAPLAVLMVPILVLRVIVRGRRGLDLFLIGSLLGLAYQLALTATAPPRQGGTLQPRALAETWGVRALLEFIGTHPARSLARDIGWLSALLVLGAVVVAIIGAAFARDPQWPGTAVFVLLCFGLSTLQIAVAFTRGFPVLPAHLFDWDQLDFIPGSRYSVLPLYLLALVVLICVDRIAARPRFGGLRLALAAPAVLCLLLGLTTDFRGGPFRSSSPRWSKEVSNARSECAHGAQRVTLNIVPDPLTISLSCEQLAEQS